MSPKGTGRQVVPGSWITDFGTAAIRSLGTYLSIHLDFHSPSTFFYRHVQFDGDHHNFHCYETDVCMKGASISFYKAIPFLLVLVMMSTILKSCTRITWIGGGRCHAWSTAVVPSTIRAKSLTLSSSRLWNAVAAGRTMSHNLHATTMSSDEVIPFMKESPKASEVTQKSEEKFINLLAIPLHELEKLVVSWGQPKYRAQQIWNWVHVQGVQNIQDMNNIPKVLKSLLQDHATLGTLQLEEEQVSIKDGTIKRAYRLSDGQIIESVLMPYNDGRYTACISSQAGCAQGCVFCATGQMGFGRQLTADEMVEQVSRFASELAAQEKEQQKAAATTNRNNNNNNNNHHHHDESKSHGRSTRLSNVVFMGST